VVVDCYAEWPGRRDYVDVTKVSAIAGVPLISNGAVTGAMIVSRAESGNPFRAEQMEVLVQFSRMVSVAYDNARLYEQVRAHEDQLERHVAQRTQELLRVLGDNDLLRGKAALAEAQSERARMVRDLHDSVAQAVYGISLGASALQTTIDPAANPSAVEPLRYILKLADAVLLEMRGLMFELRPESLRNEGLCAGIVIQLDAVRARHAIETRSNLCGEPQCEYLIKEALYRIALECIQNAVKHAHAHSIEVTLMRVDEGLYLSIEDDGIGFEPKTTHTGRMGLESVHRWAERAGGAVRVESDLGAGTRVIAELPLEVPVAGTITKERVQASPDVMRG
jgi:signal transduction histidine kinase